MADEEKNWEKVDYVDGETIITAQNLNEVQSAIKDITANLADGKTTFSIKDEGGENDGAYVTYTLNGTEITDSLACNEGNANTDQVLKDITFSSEEAGINVAGTMPIKEGATYTPTTDEQFISKGSYLSGEQVISGDANLIASNISNKVSLFGVQGTAQGGVDTSDANATADKIIKGYTAYVNDKLITGILDGVAKEFTENGTYTPDIGKFFSEITVNADVSIKSYNTSVSDAASKTYTTTNKCILIGCAGGSMAQGSRSSAVTITCSGTNVTKLFGESYSVEHDGDDGAVWWNTFGSTGCVAYLCPSGGTMGVNISYVSGSYARCWVTEIVLS